jgi:hypothetical protein
VVEKAPRNYNLRNWTINVDLGKPTRMFAKTTEYNSNKENERKKNDVQFPKKKPKQVQPPKLVKPIDKNTSGKKSSNCKSFMS